MAQNDYFCAKALVWCRLDPRLRDHAAFYHVLKHGRAGYRVFDAEILQGPPRSADRRVEFIWRSLRELASILRRWPMLQR